MLVGQYKALWSVPGAGPAVSTFHMDASGSPNIEGMTAAFSNFFNGLVTYIPNDVTVSFDTEYTVWNDANGLLVGATGVTPGTSRVGSDTGSWASGVGAVIQWETGVVESGRRLRGRTFIVPLRGGAYENNGSISTTTLAALAAKADDLIDDLVAADSALVVWSKTHHTSAAVISAAIPDRTGILRTRRA